MVAAFDNDEEMECAKAIDINPKVKRSVRNIKGMFSLPTSRYHFYPDFVAELVDGRILVVEYKGGHLIEHDQEKKNIGELWAEKSGGKALFLWAVKKMRPAGRLTASLPMPSAFKWKACLKDTIAMAKIGRNAP